MYGQVVRQAPAHPALDPLLRHAVAEHDYKDADDDEGYVAVKDGDLVSTPPLHLTYVFSF
jgi:hypothetical protein